jgi:orotidine-5'-phosphate decarboxylase
VALVSLPAPFFVFSSSGRKKRKAFVLCAGVLGCFNSPVQNPIIVALDVPTAEQAVTLAQQVAPAVGAFKIGSELFTAAGPEIVKSIRATGASVFLDLKFHDIPNTVAKAMASAVRLDVQMLTIHTGGGLAMMQAAEESAQKTAAQAGLNAPLVLGVTVLTSLGSDDLADVGITAGIGRQVERLAQLAARAGLRGLVCSPLEVAGLRQSLPSHMQFVTPGIRTVDDAASDQKRTLSAKEALEVGANWLVIGRPIYAAWDPRAAAEKIRDSLR